MERQLITIAKLSDTYDVSKNMRENRVNGHILRAQRNDVKPILGDAMYFDMMENITDTEYVLLLEGGSYDYAGNDIYFQGVLDLVAAFAYSRILSANATFVTSSGNKLKTDPNSEAQQKAVTDVKSQEAVSDALSISYGLQKFLENNITDYPLYNVSRKSDDRTSFVFLKV